MAKSRAARLLSRFLLVGVLGLLIIGLGTSTVGAQVQSCTTTPPSAQFVGVSYNTTANTSTFTYTLTSGTCPNVSHWVVGLVEACFGADKLLSSSPSGAYWIDSDPTTGAKGIKFDLGVAAGQTQTFSFTLSGLWDTAPGKVNLAVKSGTDLTSFSLAGPKCSPPPDVPEAPWAVLFPITGAVAIGAYLLRRRAVASH
jgi:hypothetical protein